MTRSSEANQELRTDIAIAAATDKISGQRFVFVSAHVPGFDYSLKIHPLLKPIQEMIIVEKLLRIYLF